VAVTLDDGRAVALNDGDRASDPLRDDAADSDAEAAMDGVHSDVRVLDSTAVGVAASVVDVVSGRAQCGPPKPRWHSHTHAGYAPRITFVPVALQSGPIAHTRVAQLGFVHPAAHVHEQDGRLPLTAVAWPLQSAALVHTFDVAHDPPVHAGSHVQVHEGRLPATKIAWPLQSVASVHTLETPQ
jgi:hypothetical protein